MNRVTQHKLLTVYLLTFCLFLSGESIGAKSNNTGVVLANLPFTSGETLYYKLSYRGLLTSMIWADIADVHMTFLANQPTHDAQKGHQFILSLSTENYSKSELIQPVRYTYTTTLDRSLQKTLLVEEIDLGKNQSHDFLWMDWKNKATELFKKREKEQLNSGFLSLDRDEVWEKDGLLAIPEFLTGFPLLENNQTYFIHKESGDKISDAQILDPLSLIYSLRTLASGSEASNGVTEFSIAVSDDIRQYRVENTGLETLNVSGNEYQAIKYEIQTDKKKDNRYYVWLNNDASKIPLRLAMDAPLGKLEIDLVKICRLEMTAFECRAGGE